MYLRIIVRRLGLLLVILAVASVSIAQEPGMMPSSQLSQADCAAAVENGGNLPDGCTPQGESVSGSRQTQQTDSAAPIQSPRLTGARPDTPERETVPPLNPSQRKKAQPPLRPQTEFEQVVADTVGRALPLFGQSLFAQPPSTYAPTDRVQVPGDYVVGPDDELQIRIWGQLNADLRVVVDRAGQVYIPRIGQISVAGVHYSELDQFLKNEIQKTFHNFSLTVSVGRIRSIQVFVVGQARYPGTYTISSLSTLVNAIFASGGPTPQGSLRDVQVQRDGKTIAHMDFYDLLVNGNKSKDIHLQSGDVLYYPPVGPLVAVAGSVNTPAIYEAKLGSSLTDLIEIAGGLSTVADTNRVTVERLDDHHLRSVLEFPLDAKSRALKLNGGDIVRVLSIIPRFENAVTLRGNVANPGRYPWQPGMRVRDLIPNAQALLTRTYWLSRAGMTDGRSTEYPIRPKLSARAKILNPEFAASDDPEQAAYSNRFDPTPPAAYGNQFDPTAAPGSLPEPTVPSQAERKKLDAETLTRDIHRASPEINWAYAIVQRINPIDLSTKLVPFDLGKAVLDGDPANNLELEAGDIVTIFSQEDISVPQSLRARYIRVEGEVVRAGVYKIVEGELLRDVLKRAGGITPEAYVYGTLMTRESAREEQQKSIDELARTLEVEIRQSAVSAAARASAEDSQTLAARQVSQEALIAQLRNTKATGRLVLALSPTAKSIDDYPLITVEDNDRIVIPHLPATVSVVGMVYNPGSFVFDPKHKVGEYLKMAGRGKPDADMHHAFLLHADGSVIAGKSVNGLFSGDKFLTLRVHPGDQVVVPAKIQTGNFVRGLRDWTQISSQLALTGAALAVIH